MKTALYVENADKIEREKQKTAVSLILTDHHTENSHVLEAPLGEPLRYLAKIRESFCKISNFIFPVFVAPKQT